MSRKNFYFKDLMITFETNNFERIVFKHLTKSNTETGGILCGKYSSDLLHADISIVSKPPKGSKLGSSTFERSVTGLPNYLKVNGKKEYTILENGIFIHIVCLLQVDRILVK